MNFVYVSDDTIHAEPEAGQDIPSSIQEALDHSARVDKVVVLIHNGRRYPIYHKQLAITILNCFESGAAFALRHGHS